MTRTLSHGARWFAWIPALAGLLAFPLAFARAEEGKDADAARAKTAEEAAAEAAKAEPGAADVSPPAELPGFDEVTTTDGSQVFGKVVDMGGGKLKVEGAFGGTVEIPWEKVASIKTANPITVELSDGSKLKGYAAPGAAGSVDIRSDAIAQPSTVALSNVTAVNPPDRPINFKGNFSLGGAMNRGNTNTRSLSILGEFEARSKSQRLTLRGGYTYADDEDGVTAQNGKGSIKYDYFFTKRFYAYASALFEHDGIQDLSLRTALTAGPGVQIIDKGDFTESWLTGMQLLFEAGVGYFNEDYKLAEDQTSVVARWSVKFDWPIVPDRIALFHFHEAFPNIEDPKENFYITTEQGIRFNIIDNFIATVQVNWRWDSDPAPGFEKQDTLYLATVGYAFNY